MSAWLLIVQVIVQGTLFELPPMEMLDLNTCLRFGAELASHYDDLGFSCARVLVFPTIDI